MSIDALWEYGDPEASERRFRAAMEGADGATRLELLTQVARTLGLRKRFAEGHQVLDEVDAALAGGASPGADAAAAQRASVRTLLERGRLHNSAGDPGAARALFQAAAARAEAAALDGLAVDAVHMVAITHSGGPEGVEWNRRGLELARRSADVKARSLIPAMLNNMAWDLLDMGRAEEALPVFREAEREWTERGREPQIKAAREAVAACLKALGRSE